MHHGYGATCMPDLPQICDFLEKRTRKMTTIVSYTQHSHHLEYPHHAHVPPFLPCIMLTRKLIWSKLYLLRLRPLDRRAVPGPVVALDLHGVRDRPWSSVLDQHGRPQQEGFPGRHFERPMPQFLVHSPSLELRIRGVWMRVRKVLRVRGYWTDPQEDIGAQVLFIGHSEAGIYVVTLG